jgi:AraC-like DNA-binding protein
MDFWDRDINVLRLSAVRRGLLKDALKTFVCKKGTRLYSRLFLVLNGETEFVFFDNSGNSKTVKAKAKDIVYLPDDAAYTSSWQNKDEIDYISIEFKLEDNEKNPILLNDEITVIATDKYNMFVSLFEDFYSSYTLGALGYKLKTRSIFFEILTNIAFENTRNDIKNIDRTMLKGILYLENNYMEEISVKELAKMSNMCETGFRAKFHKIKGMSPIEYKNYLRIKRASELLKNEDYTVSLAAETVNIPDICYFSKLFKRHMGVSPREYKSSHK